MAHQAFTTKTAAEAFAGVDGQVSWVGGDAPWYAVTADELPDPQVNKCTVFQLQTALDDWSGGSLYAPANTAVQASTAKRKIKWAAANLVVGRQGNFCDFIRTSVGLNVNQWKTLFNSAGLVPIDE